MEVDTIDDVTLGELYEATASFGTKEMQDRNKTLLGVFEHTGARLDEVRNLTTACVLIAFHVAGEGDMVMLPLHCSKISKGSLESDNRDVAASLKRLCRCPRILSPHGWTIFIRVVLPASKINKLTIAGTSLSIPRRVRSLLKDHFVGSCNISVKRRA